MRYKTSWAPPIARQVSAFRVFRAEVANAFDHYDGAFVSIDVLLTWGTNRFAATPVRHEPRSQGTSEYTFRKLVTHAMNMMTGFSTKPLQIASLVGFFFTLFGFGVLIYVLVRYFLQGTPVPGFPFLASIVALFSGAQLFALGIMGEYLARMHFRSMQKPPYVVRSPIPLPAGVPGHEHQHSFQSPLPYWQRVQVHCRSDRQRARFWRRPFHAPLPRIA